MSRFVTKDLDSSVMPTAKAVADMFQKENRRNRAIVVTFWPVEDSPHSTTPRFLSHRLCVYARRSEQACFPH
jgi:hypothetical protein